MSYENKTILICDDSALARKQLKDAALTVDAGINILEAKNGKECIEVYEANKPDLVLLDIVMPEKDGSAAVEEIMSKHPEAKIIIVSSVGTQAKLKSAIAAGAKDFIQKPISAKQIKNIITQHLA